MLIKALTRILVKNSTVKSYSTMAGLSLRNVCDVLEEFAPLKCAEAWDNVGLLIEPHTPKQIKTIFLTNDLTEGVLSEAIEKHSDLIISYHPPIFSGLKRITQSTWKERIVSICLENRIALYSPHTAWDFVINGVNDWLTKALPHSYITAIKPSPDLAGGSGRVIKLSPILTLRDAIDKVKSHTGIKNVNLALGKLHSLDDIIDTVAVCAGSGSSVLKNTPADLYLTGEMSHHDVLDATQQNISVILCNHSNSERGYLNEFKKILNTNINGACDIIVSQTDCDPLEIY